MGTDNFTVENASNYFVVKYENGFFQDEDFGDLLFSIMDLSNKSIEYVSCESAAYRLKMSGNQKYPRRYITSTDIDCSYKGIYLEVTIIAFVSNGYYENGNLDWILLFNQNLSDSIDDGLNEAIEYSLCNMLIKPEKLEIHKDQFLKRSKSLIEKHVKDLEEVYKKHSVNTFAGGHHGNN